MFDAITTRLLRQYAMGPAGAAHPAVDNLARLGITQAGAAAPPSGNN